MIKTITVSEAKKQIDENKMALIDVREPSEYFAEHIEAAVLIPLAQLSLGRLPTTAIPIAIHCRSGKRSETACQKLLAEDPTLEVYSVEGGILEWKAQGYPVKG